MVKQLGRASYTVRYYHRKDNGCVTYWGETRDYRSKAAAIRDAQGYLARYPERKEWAEIMQHKLVTVIGGETVA